MRMSHTRREALKLGGAALLATGLDAELLEAEQQAPRRGWWNWRGPWANNHAATTSKLSKELTGKHLETSVKIPGRGHSSPIVVGDRIYLTTADKSAGTQSVIAVERRGSIAWTQEIHRGGIPAENHRKNTEASPTIAFDGAGLLATFYNDDAIQLTRLTTAGNIAWQRRVGDYRPDQYKYGYAASPLIFEDLVIVVGDFDGDAFLAAHDRLSGEPKWKIRRPGTTSFSSPIVARVSGREQLLLSGGEMVASYDPVNGKELWKTPGATTMATCGTMVWDGDLVFASGGYPQAQTVAIRADGSGKLVWSNRIKCYEQSLLTHDGFLYGVADSGVAYCWKCADGETMWKHRLGGKYSSSPLLVGDTIHVFNESGDGFSFFATPDRFELIGRNKFADEIFASPVVVEDTMYLRVAHQGTRRQESLLILT